MVRGLAASITQTVLAEAVEIARALQKEALTVRLKRPTLARLRKIAMKEGTTLNVLVAAIVEAHLNRD